MVSRDYFSGKRIAVIGLGPHGEMVSDVKFLIKAGALVSIYDLKSEARRKSQLVFLRSLGLANYVCGSVPEEDLLDMDVIILSHEYPRDSSFLKAAKSKGIAIEYPETLFFRLVPAITLVGVMGSCGKSTVISMLAPMLEAVCDRYGGEGCFIVDPDSSDGILAHMKKIKGGDIVLMRIIEPMMKELHGMRISPHVAVFTMLPRVWTYEGTPFDILAYQTYNNFIVGSDEIIDMTHNMRVQPKAKMLRTKASLIPPEWIPDPKTGGWKEHDRNNAALALQTARLFKLDDEEARLVLKKWKPLHGHLELVKKIKDVEFYNDSASVNACATEAAVRSLSRERNLVLVLGGAQSGCDYRYLYSLLPQYVHSLILLPGSGTLRERVGIGTIKGLEALSAPSVEEAVRMALERAAKGDRVLFSPGFEAGGLDVSRKERGERFMRAVRSL